MLHTLSDVNRLPDPLKQFQFTFCISKIRGSDGLAGAFIGESTNMTDSQRSSRYEIQCTSYSWPGAKMSTTETVIYGHRRTRPSIQDKSGKWKTRVIETQDGAIIQMIRNWMDAIYNPVTGLGLPSELYVSRCEIKMSTPLTNKSIWLRGFYPLEMGNIQIDPSSSKPVEVDVTWNYDWTSESSLNTLNLLGL